MKANVYNLQGQVAKELELADSVFNVKVKPEVVHEVYVAQMNNQREPWAHSKNRGEVRGGGRKPWKQKGTGNARHGSIRSPIWKGGGVAFGPLSERNYTTKINKKTRRVALKMCLTDKLQNGTLWIVEDLKFTEPKTKLFAEFLKKLSAKQKSFLVLTPATENSTMVRMTKNIPRIQTLPATQVSVMDMLSKQAVIVSVEGIKKVEELLSK